MFAIKTGLEQAKNNLVSALEALDSGIPLDLVLIDIRKLPCSLEPLQENILVKILLIRCFVILYRKIIA